MALLADLTHAFGVVRVDRWSQALVLIATTVVVVGLPARAAGRRAPSCPSGMTLVSPKNTPSFCIDRFEASLEVRSGARWRKHSPFDPVGQRTVRAVSKRGVIPQAYISGKEAAAACRESEKHLCSESQWMTSCQGKNAALHPYGARYRAGFCNDRGISGFDRIFQQQGRPDDDTYSFEAMNDPRINRVRGTVAKTGSFSRCKSAVGVYDMVGNVAEWIDDASGTFRGGFYLSHAGQGSSSKRGEGCNDGVIGHTTDYRDYSTGFRCCASPR